MKKILKHTKDLQVQASHNLNEFKSFLIMSEDELEGLPAE